MKMFPLKHRIFFLFLLSLSLFCSSNLKSENRRILVLWAGGGEHETATRLEKAFNGLNYVCKIVSCEEPSTSVDAIAQEFNPDLVIALNERCQSISSSQATRFLWIAGHEPRIFSSSHLFKNRGAFLNYDGFMYASSSLESIKTFMESSGKTFH